MTLAQKHQRSQIPIVTIHPMLWRREYQPLEVRGVLDHVVRPHRWLLAHPLHHSTWSDEEVSAGRVRHSILILTPEHFSRFIPESVFRYVYVVRESDVVSETGSTTHDGLTVVQWLGPGSGELISSGDTSAGVDTGGQRAGHWAELQVTRLSHSHVQDVLLLANAGHQPTNLERVAENPAIYAVGAVGATRLRLTVVQHVRCYVSRSAAGARHAYLMNHVGAPVGDD